MTGKEEEKIENYAEKLVLEYYSEPQIVDPYAIANYHHIKVYQGSFSDKFKGLIRYHKGNFKIYLNLDVLGNHEYQFARYTCSHEIGHALIPDHRSVLMKGKSLSFNLNPESEISGHVKNKYEQQAQCFAASLLMPASWFKTYCKGIDISLEYLYNDLKNRFQTSLTSTAVRSMKLNLSNAVFIRISHTLWSVPSKDFKIKLDNNRAYFKYNENRNRNIIKSKKLESGGYIYELSYLNLSSWTTNISVGSKYDFLIREEIIYTPRSTFCLLSIEG